MRRLRYSQSKLERGVAGDNELSCRVNVAEDFETGGGVRASYFVSESGQVFPAGLAIIREQPKLPNMMTTPMKWYE